MRHTRGSLARNFLAAGLLLLEAHAGELDATTASLIASVEGHVAARGGSWSVALEKYESALEGDPENASAAMGAGWAALNLGIPARAIEHFGRVHGPAETDALHLMARAQVCAGDEMAALELFSRCLSLDSRLPWNPCLLPDEPASSDVGRMVLYWQRAAAEQPNSALASWFLGNALSGMDRLEEAVAPLERALDLKRADLFGQSLAMVLLRLGRVEEARARIRRTLEDAPDNQMALMIAADIEASLAERAVAAVGDLIPQLQSEELAWEDFLARKDAACAVLSWSSIHDRRILELGKREVALVHIVRAAARDAAWAGDFDAFTALANRYVLFSDARDAHRILDLSDASRKLRAYEKRPPSTPLEKYHRAALVLEQHVARRSVAGDLPLKELREVVRERSDFVAAKVLLADLLQREGSEAESIAILEALLEEFEHATRVRLTLASRLPLDRALEVLASTPERDRMRPDVLRLGAELALQAGDASEALARALEALRRFPQYSGDRFSWSPAPTGLDPGLCEVVALVLEQRGDRDRALDMVETTSLLHASSRGTQARARLREQLSRPGVVEAWIDAWRHAPSESPERARSFARLNELEAEGFGCSTCAGKGYVLRERETTNLLPLEDMSVAEANLYSYREICQRCLGLGLWHSAVL